MLSVTHLHTPSERRRGAVLLIVMSLLALFAAVGLSFVFYANAEATASNHFRDAATMSQGDIEPELALSLFLGKLIYGDKDDSGGAGSSLRGHDLATGIYGRDYIITNINGVPTVVLGSTRTPYNGSGRLHYQFDPKSPGMPAILTTATTAAPTTPPDNYELIQYKYFPADGFVRDPGRYGFQGTPYGLRTDPNQTMTSGYLGGLNVPWTYPDLNNLALAAVKADGSVLTPSFHREYLFGQLSQDDLTNPNWLNGIGKYLTVRPRPVDQLTKAELVAAGLWPPPLNPTPVQQKALHDMILALQTQGKVIAYPEARNGDVNNLGWGPNGNESIWIDANAPVMIGPDGRMFKFMFAPLMIDLDGRVNLNVHGNIINNNNVNAYAGNQGWGRWEVNLEQVLPVQSEVQNIFLGNNTLGMQGRYGSNSVPDGNSPFIGGNKIRGPWYSRVDMDGVNSGALKLPAGITSAFAAYPGGVGRIGYKNSSAAELLNHPAQFNFWAAGGNDIPPAAAGADRIFSTANMEALLRYGDKGSPALTSDPFRLLPQNFAQTRARNLVTLRSFNVAAPGLTPWVWDRSAGIATSYAYNAIAGYPRATAGMPFPPLPTLPVPPKLAVTPPQGSDFTTESMLTDVKGNSNWRGVMNAVTRLDLNRTLTDYPLPDVTETAKAPGGGLITKAATLVTFQQAQTDRQTFAKDIYKTLINATGALDPNTDATIRDPKLAEFQAARWLAQLAVNIVDYIDNDDYMTPFRWFVDPTDLTKVDWVFGTELPRLVMNEAYLQFDNDVAPAPKTGLGYYKLNAWVELYNPFNPSTSNSGGYTAYPRDNGTAFLVNLAGQPIYQVVLSKPDTNNLQDPANARGEPTGANVLSLVGDPTNLANSWAPDAAKIKDRVLPANGSTLDKTQTNAGFYVLGPQTGFANALQDPGLPTTFTSKGASATWTFPIPIPLPRPTVLLRRLACPHLPFDNNQKTGAGAINPSYNPYITVDYLENVRAWNQSAYTPAGGPRAVPLAATRSSFGRLQPYTAYNPPPLVPAVVNLSQFRAQSVTVKTQPKNTFYSVNTPRTNPFEWLTHLDRPLISPLELLYVSGYRPHLLTQKFTSQDPLNPVDAKSKLPIVTRQQHYAPWFSDDARIYRFFEFVRVRDLATGNEGMGRVAGDVNINTIWDQETIAALTNNPQAAAIFTAMMNLRTPNYSKNQIGPTDGHTANPVDRPFRSLSTGPTKAVTPPTTTGGQYPVDTGINNTILRSGQPGGDYTTARALDDTTGAHPYVKHAPLMKMFNNLTTRSNVFAVWVTVGLFEVRLDPADGQYKIGAEVGRLENRQVRHRMFAIVDRSDLRLLDLAVSAVNPKAKTPQTVTVNFAAPPAALPNGTTTTLSGSLVQLNVGDLVVIEPNTNREETAAITTVGPTSFTVTSNTVRSVGAQVIIRGNPGPWPNYNPRLDKAVVPYFSVID